MPGSAQRNEAPSAASPSAYDTRLTEGAKRGTRKSTATCAESGTVNAVPQKITQTKAIAASSSVHAAGAPNTKRRTTCTTRLRNRTAKTPAPTQSAQRESRSTSTATINRTVIPAKTSEASFEERPSGNPAPCNESHWVPACAGTTNLSLGYPTQ